MIVKNNLVPIIPAHKYTYEPIIKRNILYSRVSIMINFIYCIEVNKSLKRLSFNRNNLQKGCKKEINKRFYEVSFIFLYAIM